MGMNYFITAQGYPLLGMVTTLIGAIPEHYTGPAVYLCFSIWISQGRGWPRCLPSWLPAFSSLCVLYRKKHAGPLSTCAGPILYLSKGSWLWVFPFPDSQPTDSIIIIAMNAVLQYHLRAGLRGYAHHLRHHRPELYDVDYLPHAGITGGSQPLISFNYGANKPERIRKIVFCVLMLCIGFTSFMFPGIQVPARGICGYFYQ